MNARASVALALLALACASGPERGVVHVVEPGETVWRISRHYGVALDDVVRVNGIADVTTVAIGTRLWIPGRDGDAPTWAGTRPAPAPPSERPVRDPAAGVEQARYEARNAAIREELRFAWPLHGTVTSRFGRRRGRPHEGIDLAARKGTNVRAAEAGRVTFAGRLGAYGNLVVVRHHGAYSTVYAHNRRNHVRKGEWVEKGAVIAEVGDSGNATGPHLHFEIRYDERARNPEHYLP